MQIHVNPCLAAESAACPVLIFTPRHTPPLSVQVLAAFVVGAFVGAGVAALIRKE